MKTTDLNKSIEVLRAFVDSDDCTPKMKGRCGMVIHELKTLSKELEAYELPTDNLELKNEVRQFVNEFNNDKVIRAYVKTRKDWADTFTRVRELSRELGHTLKDDFDDSDRGI